VTVRGLQKFRIPDGTVIPRLWASRCFTEYQFQIPIPACFPVLPLIRRMADAVHLSAAGRGGNLTGLSRQRAVWGGGERGLLGRYTNSTGVVVALSQHTFGVDNPSNAGSVSPGTGLPNAYPKWVGGDNEV